MATADNRTHRSANQSVEEHLRSWLKSSAKPKVANRTYERYEAIVERHLIPAFGGFDLQRLHPKRRVVGKSHII